eukprot:TRINITY_DN4766_c1_g2_i4.p1 TRINITY_DN4766_c1_g2~~TRINITY_DN4766_c1_g2_i4.p1  ORF type:complete len:639 (-),score=112.13 TRINITY_DN4766_c1_g2_i4:552-2360(-)
MSGFETLGVMPEIIQTLQDMDWDLPRDIQEEAIPLILGGADVMAAAETGSGKTCAFALPIVQIVSETIRSQSNSCPLGTKPIPRMSLANRDPELVLDSEGLVCTNTSQDKWYGGRGNFGVSKGKYYYEVTCTDDGLSRVGWASACAKYNLGTDNKGFGFGGTGKSSNNSQFETYGKPFGKGDTVGCFIDQVSHTIKFSVNGEVFPNAFQIPPTMHNVPMYPAIVIRSSSVKINFGGKPLKYPPKDFLPLSSVTIGDTQGKAVERKSPLAIIFEPSRELAIQTHEAIVKFSQNLTDIRCCLLTGGDDGKSQLRELERGVDIVTGTVGKIDFMISQNKLSLQDIKFFVLDEADSLVSDSTTYSQLISYYKAIPSSASKPQVLLFSATLYSPMIDKLSEAICSFPQIVDLKGKLTIPKGIDHALLMIDPAKPYNIVHRIVTDGVHANGTKNQNEAYSEAIKARKGDYLIKIIDKYQMSQALIFVRTKLDADNLKEFMNKLNATSSKMVSSYSCEVLHGGRDQASRNSALDQFKKGDVRFLIATDVAARGLDIQSLPFVISLISPKFPKFTTHHHHHHRRRRRRLGSSTYVQTTLFRIILKIMSTE